MNEYTVERLGHQGDGITSGSVFVPGALPGETVTGTPEGDQLKDVRIVKPSEFRVKAPCRHAKSCGGCSLQHASDAFVEDFKMTVVETALKARGISARPEKIQTSPPGSRRRAVFSARRTKKGALAGFHKKGSDTVIEVPDCQILRPALLAIVPAIEALTIIGSSRKGEMRFTVTETGTGIDIYAEGGKPAEGALMHELAQTSGRFNITRLTWGDEIVAMQEPPAVLFADVRAGFPAGAFLQATKDAQESLISLVTETVSGAKKLVDLFAGCGTFALPLAGSCEVHAVEGERQMTDALMKSWRQAGGLKMVTTEVRDLFRRPLLPDELNRFDAAVIDPPRAGAEAQIAELAKSEISLIAMVSCNPVSFARDAQTLVSAGFEMRSLTAVDQFRWSAHVEVFATFTRK